MFLEIFLGMCFLVVLVLICVAIYYASQSPTSLAPAVVPAAGAGGVVPAAVPAAAAAAGAVGVASAVVPAVPAVPAPTTTSTGVAITYGESTTLLNQWASGDGTVVQHNLSVCNYAPSGDNCGAGSGNVDLVNDGITKTTWTFVPLTGSNTGTVNYGDKVQLQSGTNYLTTCGVCTDYAFCGINVVTKATQDPSGWRVLDNNGTPNGPSGNGGAVNNQDIITLQSLGNGSFLCMCGGYGAGGTCGQNVSLRTDTTLSNLNSVAFWQISKAIF